MYKRYRSIAGLLMILFSFTCLMHVAEAQKHKAADLIVFSFHRPMQLYALLESVTKYFSHLNQVYVLYRTDTQEYEAAYQEIQAMFPQIQFVKQGSNPRLDFKPLLLQCFLGSPAEYILFSVDDDIVKGYVDINECIEAMETSDAYGFYLRLGANINWQYYQNIRLPVPPCTEVKSGIFQYRFNNGMGDWAYPHNLDMTLFKKSKIEGFFRNADYSSPNTLEGTWAGVADLNNYGLFFTTSKKFTLPLNIVQQDWWCPNENSFTVEDLFMKWKSGLKIDISQFHKIKNNCTFMGYQPIFVSRSCL